MTEENLGQQAAQEGANMLLNLAEREEKMFQVYVAEHEAHRTIDYSLAANNYAWSKRNEGVATLLIALSLFVLMATIIMPVWLFTR